MNRNQIGQNQRKNFKFLFIFTLSVCFSMSALSQVFDSGDATNGKKLFNSTCVACHRLDTDKLVGPGLGGLEERWTTSEEMLKLWMSNPAEAIASGDEYIMAMMEGKTASMMPPAVLSDDELADLMTFIKHGVTEEEVVEETADTSAEIDESSPAEQGKKLFNANCAACHKTSSEKLIGPGLGGLADRWGASDELLTLWIQNPAEALESGDPYITQMVEKYKATAGLMAAQALSVEEVAMVLDYIENGAPSDAATGGEKINECVTIHDTQSEESEANIIWYVIIIIILLIVIISLSNMKRSLVNTKRREDGMTPMPKESMGRSLRSWMWKNVIIVSIIGVVFFGYLMTAGYIDLMGIAVHEGYEPEQPILFSHAVHACENDIDCEYCHHLARDSKHAGIPPVNVCMNCHKGVREGTKTGKAEIAKIYEAAGYDLSIGGYPEDHVEKPIQWVKVHNMPDHVYFSHTQHVEVGGLNCRNCHGAVETFVSGRVAPVEEINKQDFEGLIKLTKPTLTMGWCVECHNKAEIDLTEGGYYEEMHSRMTNSERGKVELERISADDHISVKELGGWECAKCHY